MSDSRPPEVGQNASPLPEWKLRLWHAWVTKPFVGVATGRVYSEPRDDGA